MISPVVAMNPPPPPPWPATTSAAFSTAQQPNPGLTPSSSMRKALSDISSLLHLSTTVLQSLPISGDTSSQTLFQCPFNRNHRIPPSYLFSHSLNCPSHLSLAHTFQYPLTLHSSHAPANSTAVSSPGTSSDVSVTLEGYTGYTTPTNNFFYQNCPGPVTPSSLPPFSINLPSILLTECSEFTIERTSEKPLCASVDFIRFLPSEILAIRTEVETWGGYFPAVYSSRILRVILKLRDCNLFHSRQWIVANSPRYGVIIDFSLGDHVFLLVTLCLKVIVKEAFRLSCFMFSDEELIKERNDCLGPSNRSFACPLLVEVMTWLTLQLNILYGEVNAKIFAIDVLKECISQSALRASFFSVERKDSDVSNDLEKIDCPIGGLWQSIVPTSGTQERDGEDITGEVVGCRMIFISQVAAAVAALHERSSIEEKLKGLRSSKSAYQRNMEHAYVSNIADEERQKRPDYRPLIEHDGFLWQRSSNQDSNKGKTREELLAEERDYKRRRMSYRGKKLKRNGVEVLRDIIEEYMEEIKQAETVGCMSNAMQGTKALASENFNAHVSAAVVSGSGGDFEVVEDGRSQSIDFKGELNSHLLPEDFEYEFHQSRHDSSRDRAHEDPSRATGKTKHYRNVYTGIQNRKSSLSRKQMLDRENQNDVEGFREGSSPRSRVKLSESRDRNQPKRKRDHHERDIHKKEREEKERNSHKTQRGEGDWGHRHKDGRRSKIGRVHHERGEDNGLNGNGWRSKTKKSSGYHEFQDRYDPSESHVNYEDDF